MSNLTGLHLRLRLENVNSTTEEIYLNLGRSFPELFRELELGFRESSKLVSRVAGDSRATQVDEGRVVVADAVAEAKEVIDQVCHFFSSLGQQDKAFLESISMGIDSLTSLQERIAGIRKDSVEMQLVALNAILVARKAGKEGLGFASIAGELNSISAHTATHTREVSTQGEKTQRILHAFQGKLDRIQCSQETFYEGFQTRLDSGFQACNNGLYKMTDLLAGIIDEAKRIKKPLYRIMEEVQLQDIIRQSVMHVIVSLEEIDIDLETDSNDYYLDEMSFIDEISDLCVIVLDDIDTKITNSLAVFTENLTDLRYVMRNVEEERATFLRLVVADDLTEQSQSSLDQMFSGPATVLQELVNYVQRCTEDKRTIEEDGTLLIEELTTLESTIERSVEVVKYFFHIKVLSGIEIATQRALAGHTTAIQQMDSLTSRMNKDVRESLDILNMATSQTVRTMSRFSNKTTRETAVVQQMADRIRESYERLTFSKDSLLELLQSFSIYSDRFTVLLDDTERDLERLSETVDSIASIKEQVRQLQMHARGKKEKKLSEIGVEKWSIGSDRLRRLIDQFTVYSHKKTAGAIGGFEVEEECSSEGELTLF